MRFLLSLLLAVVATSLVCHGVYLEDEGRRALQVGDQEAADLSVIRSFPYTIHAVQAREDLLDKNYREDVVARGASYLPLAWQRIESSVREEAPWLGVEAAGALAILGLLISVLLPGTRFRGTALLLLLAGTAALMPNYMEAGRQVELIDAFEPMKQVIAFSPWLAIALMYCASLALGFRRPPRVPLS